MKDAEPPSPEHPSNSTFLLGQDGHGNWVVQDDRHRCGGLFVDRKQAIKFALFENGNQPQAIVVVPGILELDMTGGPTPVHGTAMAASVSSLRIAA
jgi:hypothetical protein